MQIIFAGDPVELRYTAVSVSEAEKKLGKSLSNALSEGLTLEHQAVIVWAGMKHADRKLSPQGVLERFDVHRQLGGSFDRDVVRPALVFLAEEGFLGDIDASLWKKNLLGEEGKG